jgi:hypothetical protein
MRRGTIIVVVFIVIAAAIIGISQFLRAQPPYPVTIAVSPLAFGWVNEAAARFNAAENITASGQRIAVSITPLDDLDVLSGASRWSADARPDGWLPAADFAVDQAAERYPLARVRPSTARTVLMWGAFADRADALTGNGVRALDWADVQRIADGGRWSAIGAGSPAWGNFTFAMPRPNRAISGYAALLSAAGAFGGSREVTPTLSNPAFRTAFENVIASVPSFSTLGSAPAAAIAARGASVGEVALLAESEWLVSLTNELIRSDNPIRFTYPAYNVTFTFPLARWDDASVPRDTADAITRFGAHLLSSAEQGHAQSFGLRPATGEALGTRFAQAAAFGVRVPLPALNEVIPPSRTSFTGLTTWLNGVVR